MTCYENNEICTLTRVVGNREAIGAVLQDIDGNAIDLTGRTIKFRMVLISDGTVKINNAAATIVDAEAGEVSYSPSASDVNTAGRYAMYWVDDTETPNRLWPYDGARWVLNLVAETDYR